MIAGLRARLYGALDPTQRRRGLSLLNGLIVAAILVSVVVAVLDTEQPLAQRYAAAFLAADVVLTVIFASEYLLRLWTAPENPRYRGPLGRLRWAVTPSALLDLAALAPALIYAGATPAYLFRLLRLARILRLAKLGRFSQAWNEIVTAVQSRRDELVLTFVAALGLMLVAATLLHLVEGSSQPEQFGSIPRALWWAVVTLTTIGYGDVYPHSVLGKMLASLTAFCGIGLIAAPTGILASAFSEAAQRRRARETGEA